ncbi:phytanoyl-CoA dioxygenase family protein [Gemmata sp. JC717]|uniref:phytanoyl-CoA dioxygenase family protein n=1 Tax=Gemmata algarum TaxID=2975278 RepID=UPI0021BBA06F|nr:phytanoyl-CoA dioxygenase family protein [Gemmata algarum]MDY3554280.1 phytanoyl-CoA dioxygenase family protein [Gemmata algarum]
MIKSYGVRETTAVGTEAERHAEEIRLCGFTVLRGVVRAEYLDAARAGLDRLYAEQAAAAGGADRLARINDANIVRCPLAQDDLFLELVTQPRLLAVAAALLGEYFVLQQQNGVINPPAGDNYQAAWHRDLPYQHFVSSRPLALSALVCIDPFTAETGGTCVLPGSHKSEQFPSADYVRAHERGAVGDPGDVLVFDSMLYHRAGTNRSGRLRRGLNNVLGLPLLQQQISLPRALGGRFAEDPFLRKFLGYETEPAGSSFEWRGRRLEKLAG